MKLVLQFWISWMLWSQEAGLQIMQSSLRELFILRGERSRLQRKTSLVTSALKGIFELENMENRFMTFLHCCCNLLHFCWTFTLRFFRALVVLRFVQNFHGNWWFPSLESRGLQRFLCILSLASASRLNLVSVSTLAFAGQNYTKWIQSATAGQSHDVQVVIPGIEARSQILSKHKKELGPCCTLLLLLWVRHRCSPYQSVLLKVKRYSAWKYYAIDLILALPAKTPAPRTIGICSTFLAYCE